MHLEDRGKAPLVAPPAIMKRIAEAAIYQDEFVRETRDPRAISDPEYVRWAKVLIGNGENETVARYFLGTGLVTIHDLGVDEELKKSLRGFTD
jgi:hypothetical protein